MFEIVFPYIFAFGIGLIVFSVTYRSFFLPYSVRTFRLTAKECESLTWFDAYHSYNDDDRRELLNLSNDFADFADKIRNDSFDSSIINDYHEKLTKVMPKDIKSFDRLSQEKQMIISGRLFLFCDLIRYVAVRNPLLIWTLIFHLHIIISAFVLWNSYCKRIKNVFDFNRYHSPVRFAN